MVDKNISIKLTVTSNVQELPGYRSVIFKRPKNFNFNAGDWMDINVFGEEIAGGKTFSLSSSPTEEDLMITFREGLSPFKKVLSSALPNDKFVLLRWGNYYDFRISENKSTVLIAGGVGIAPFRSMLKEAYDHHYTNTIHLIYLSSKDDFLFRPELQLWEATLKNLKIDYLVTGAFGRKERENKMHQLLSDTNQEYYIAGPPGMVTNTVNILKKYGVHEDTIKIDSFDGY